MILPTSSLPNHSFQSPKRCPKSWWQLRNSIDWMMSCAKRMSQVRSCGGFNGSALSDRANESPPFPRVSLAGYSCLWGMVQGSKPGRTSLRLVASGGQWSVTQTGRAEEEALDLSDLYQFFKPMRHPAWPCSPIVVLISRLNCKLNLRGPFYYSAIFLHHVK